MKYKNLIVSLYLLVLGLFIFCFTSGSDNLKVSAFENAIQTFEYQLQSPDLYALKNDDTIEVVSEEEKVVYLTFDDGPSPRTGEILDILNKYEVKATFFVVKPQEEDYTQYLIRTAQEGHSIGIHTASHKYKEIYSSIESYIADFEEIYEYIEISTGQTPRIFRFPGGSVNDYNEDIITDLTQEMSRRGFVYFDWNVESSDSNSNLSSSSIYNNVIKGVGEKDRAVVIMHDSYTRKTTVGALEDIIVTLLDKGYVFEILDSSVKPIQFKIK